MDHLLEPAVSYEPPATGEGEALDRSVTPSRGRQLVASAVAALSIGTLGTACGGESSSTPMVEMAESADGNVGYDATPPTTAVVTHHPAAPSAMVALRSEARPAAAPSAEYTTVYGQELLIPRAEVTGQELLDILAHNHETALAYQDEMIPVEQQIARALEMIKINLSDKVDLQLADSIKAQFVRAHNFHRGDPLQKRTEIFYILGSERNWQLDPGGKTATVKYTARDTTGTSINKTMVLGLETISVDGTPRQAWQILYNTKD